MLFLLDYIEVVPEVNSSVQITELDDTNGVFCHTLHGQEDAGITLQALSDTPISSTMRVMGRIKQKYFCHPYRFK